MFNSQHNWEDVHDHMMSTRIDTLIMNNMCSKFYQESNYGLNLDLLYISYQSHVPYPRRNRLLGKSDHLRSIHLKFEWFMIGCKSKNGHQNYI